MAKRQRIYLDTAAATPMDKRVIKAMTPYFSRDFGNPGSLHLEGVIASKTLAFARDKIAKILDTHSDEIIFTSGGTEGDNLAIIGVARGLLAHKKIASPGHIITTATEHRAVLEAGAVLEREGWAVTYAPVDEDGLLNLKAFKEALRPETVLVSVMYANNEIGTIQPIKEVAKILRHFRKERGENRLPYLHTDACQAPRFLPLSVEKLGVDLLTLNGSKIYGPKGVGCLYIKRNTFLNPLLVGGGQELGRRSGTENVAGAVGLATALEIADKEREKESAKLSVLRDYFIEKILILPGTHLNGGQSERLPNNINITFDKVFGELMVLRLDAKGIACSIGSACSSHKKDDRHVIMALGKTANEADNAVRFTLGRATTKKDLDFVIEAIKDILNKSK